MAAFAETLVKERTPQQGIPIADKTYYQGKISERQLVDQICRYHKEDSDRMARIMDVMLRCYDQYRGKYDFSDKEEWQSRITINKGHAAVKHAVANILKLLVQSPQPVSVEEFSGFQGYVKMFFAADVEKAVTKLWESAHYREVLRDILEGGFACGLGALKVNSQMGERNFTSIGYNDEGQMAAFTETRLQWHLGLHSIDPWKITFGPRSGQMGKIDRIIETVMIDIPTLRAMGFDSEAIKKLEKEDVNSPKEELQEHRKDLRIPRESLRKECMVWEYFGDVVDEQTQEIIAYDQHIFIGNQHSILKVEDCPYWDKKKGYVLFSPLNVAFRFPGEGLLEQATSIHDAITEIAQMDVDHLKFSLLNMFEVDMQMMENPEDIATGVEPGKFFRKRPGTGGVQMIRPVEINPLTGDSFNALSIFHNEYQRNTFITDVTQGMLDTKGETTATEVSQVQANTTLMLSDISLHIEDTLISPMAELTWDRAFQYIDANSNPNWSMLLGDWRGQYFDSLPIDQRVAMVQGDYRFIARGLSRSIERTMNLQKLINFVQVIGQFGEVFVPFVNMPDIFRRIFESFHFEDPHLMLSPQAIQIQEQMQHNLVMAANPATAAIAQMGSQMALQGAKTQGAIDTANVGAENQAVIEMLKGMMQMNKGGPGEGKTS